MKTVLVLLVIASVLVSVLLTLGTLWGLIQRGPSVGITATFLLLSTVCGYLIFTLRRILSWRGSLPEIPGSSGVDESTQRRLAPFFTGGVVLGIFAAAFVLFGFAPGQNWIGLVFFVFGLSLFSSAYYSLMSRRNRLSEVTSMLPASQLQQMEQAVSSLHKKIVYVVSANVVIAICSILYSFSPGASRYFSIWDLVGFLFFLSSSCVWFLMYGRSMQTTVDTLKKQVVY